MITTVFGAAARAAAEREQTALSRSDPFANRACKLMLARVARRPNDPRLSEALDRCIRATRWAARDDKTTSWSRRAFQALHRRYGKTSWAAQTTYHY